MRSRPCLPRRGSLLALVGLGLSISALAAARPRDPVIDLAFLPPAAARRAGVAVDPSLTGRPVQLVLRDGRPADARATIGSREVGDGAPEALTTGGDVAGFVESVTRRLFDRWGVRVESAAPRVLEIELRTFEVRESRRAVGARYAGRIRLGLTLRGAGGGIVWAGGVTADASSFGRRSSVTSCNEALSDALLESLVATLGAPGLRQAWSGRDGG